MPPAETITPLSVTSGLANPWSAKGAALADATRLPDESSRSSRCPPEISSPTTCALIESEFAALGTDSSWHFDPNEWCASEVVGHMVEGDKRGFAGRIREILNS